ncbi:phosphorylcholine transferase LicD [Selenomonas ruminantium]|uniref:LicD family protein n=1 Tax=Selenomonas ruminantium TaxID=971 RepID=UPI0026F0C656|nr:LicD family protein [Selenomonas ruminantium]
MKKISLRELQLIELDVLEYFVKFCKKNNLRYVLIGGSLLGAIRHKGFIPWDDDIDIGMPRPDYERLKKLTLNTEKYKMLTFDRMELDIPLIKIVDKRTVVESSEDGKHHVWIDVIPIDGLPADDIVTSNLYKKIFFYRKISILCRLRWGQGRSFIKKLSGIFLKPLAQLLWGSKKCAEMLEEIATSNDYETSDYVGVVTWGRYGVGEKMPKDKFEKFTEVEFEGKFFQATSYWDSYLTGIYGDYMKLPPLDQQMGDHQITAYIE